MKADNYVINEEENPAVEEAYKVLRANIFFRDSDRKLRTISITSYSPGEGKTTTAINLAICMAKLGIKVLFVDADLRKPAVMKNLGSKNFKGLTTYILGHAAIEDIIYATNKRGFYFVPCGVKPPNPSELVASDKFNEFLKKASEQFELVIVDTPPLGSVIDGAVTAAKTDGTIIVIEPNKVKFRNARMVKEQLEKANARILGVILNKVDKFEYKSYYGGYDYYGSHKKYTRGRLKKIIFDKWV